jgi:hypothetical protein
MRILFVPFAEGGIGHIIPLMALASRLKGAQHQTALLVPPVFHKNVKKLGFNVLDIDYTQSQGGFLKELAAFSIFKPDVVVDDSSLTTLFSTRLGKKPRVAIQRTGMFPGANPRMENRKYEFDRLIVSDHYKYYWQMGFTNVRKYTDLFAADMKLVPGIKSIEVLPDHLQSDPTYVFCGPLIVDDVILEEQFRSQEKGGEKTAYRYEMLDSFFDTNKNRFKVFLTYGSIASANRSVINAAKYLIDHDVAVITTIEIPDLPQSQRELCLTAQYIPMNYVCSRVDMMIHHCGSGTYQYQILHLLPSITIGTKFQDREDIALRLEELNVNRHLPCPEDCQQFPELFRKTFNTFFHSSPSLYQAAKKRLVRLKEETERVSAAFDFESVLEQAVGRSGFIGN